MTTPDTLTMDILPKPITLHTAISPCVSIVNHPLEQGATYRLGFSPNVANEPEGKIVSKDPFNFIFSYLYYLLFVAFVVIIAILFFFYRMIFGKGRGYRRNA